MHIELEVEQMTRIVREVLTDDYHYIQPDDPDFPGLRDAIKVVLEYYMSPSEYEQWLKDQNIKPYYELLNTEM